jgi:hypothetical protein
MVGGAGGMGGAGGAGGMQCLDDDGDGVDTCSMDCDDSDATSYPGAIEICGDAADNDCNGTPDDTCSGLGTYVSDQLGDDANPGTQAMPVKTIHQGITNAVTIGNGVEVYVDKGTYAEKVVLAEGHSVLGGHDAANGWMRDPLANDSTIVNVDFEGVLADSSITRQTELDGFRVVGLSGNPPFGVGTRCISLDGGTPTITNNRVFGGGANQGASKGIYINAESNDPLGALVAGNQVTVGTSPESAVGIEVAWDGWPTPPVSPGIAEIVANTVSGGAAKYNSGIALWESGPGTLAQDNTILAGTSTAGGDAWGMTVGGEGEVNANRVNVDQVAVGACTGSNWCGGIMCQSCAATFTNNVAFGVKGAKTAGFAVWEAEGVIGEVEVNGNYFDGGGQQTLTNGAFSTAIMVRTSTGVTSVIGRYRNNILIGGSNKARYGVYEDQGNQAGQNARPEALENNDFFFPALFAPTTDTFYSDWDGANRTQITMLSGVNALPNVTVGANINEDPMNGPGFHLTAGSKCIDAGTATGAPAVDFEGEARPQGLAVDIGPDEAM